MLLNIKEIWRGDLGESEEGWNWLLISVIPIC